MGAILRVHLARRALPEIQHYHHHFMALEAKEEKKSEILRKVIGNPLCYTSISRTSKWMQGVSRDCENRKIICHLIRCLSRQSTYMPRSSKFPLIFCGTFEVVMRVKELRNFQVAGVLLFNGKSSSAELPKRWKVAEVHFFVFLYLDPSQYAMWFFGVTFKKSSSKKFWLQRIGQLRGRSRSSSG